MLTTCFLDLDGVPADFTKSAFAWHERPYVSPARYDFWRDWPMDTADFFRPMGFTFWESLDKTAEADEVFRLLESVFGPDNICLLTNPCGTEGCEAGKRAWVKRHYPRYERQLLLGSAKDFCGLPGALLVDDYNGNVDSFPRRGGKAVLFPRPWNRLAGTDPLAWLSYQLDRLLVKGAS